MILRRSLLLALLFAVFISGCEKFFGDGYSWYKRGNSATGYSWLHIGACVDDVKISECSARVKDICKDNGFVACADYAFDGSHCRIWSRYSERVAKTMKINGRTLFEHEVGKLRDDGSLDSEGGVGHCAGYDHYEHYARSV